MSTFVNRGTVFSKLSDLKEGDRVEVTGFTCIKDHTICGVFKGPHGLYVRCADGKHYLEGQTVANNQYGGGDVMVGVRKVQ